jgi:hypothetical protein
MISYSTAFFLFPSVYWKLVQTMFFVGRIAPYLVKKIMDKKNKGDEMDGSPDQNHTEDEKCIQSNKLS